MKSSSRETRTVAVIGSVGLPAKYGGFETLVEHLGAGLKNTYTIHVYCSGRRYLSRQAKYRGINLHYIPLDANGLSSIPYDIVSMIHAARYADVILVLGVSGCIFLPILKRFSKVKIILNVDGIEWRRDKWSAYAKWFLRKSESVGSRYADSVVADNEEIRKYLDTTYGIESVNIAYGGDHARTCAYSDGDKVAYPFIGGRYMVAVCRIEPENNLHLIVSACSRYREMATVIVGNWSSSSYGRALRSKFEHVDHLYLLDPVYDEEPLNKIRGHAALYLHGHSAGGTNPSLVEAMALGLPVVAYDVGFNRATTENKALYFRDESTLVNILSQLNKEVLDDVASEMKKVAAKRYTWRTITTQYAGLLC